MLMPLLFFIIIIILLDSTINGYPLILQEPWRNRMGQTVEIVNYGTVDIPWDTICTNFYPVGTQLF